MKKYLLTSIVVNASGHTKCASLSNKKCEIQLTLIILYPSEYGQELHYYQIKVDRCVSNKTENLNLSMFNLITGITKHISRECKCKFDSRKYNLNQKWNNDKC